MSLAIASLSQFMGAQTHMSYGVWQKVAKLMLVLAGWSAALSQKLSWCASGASA